MNNPLIYIEWCDAASMSNEWEDVSVVLKWAEGDDSWLVCEVGFVLKETDEYLLLCSQMNDKGNVGDVIKIPKTWVRRRVELGEYVKK